MVATLLSLASLAAFYAAMIRRVPYTWSLFERLNVDGEGSLPAWFSSALIGACAVAQLCIARLERGRGAGLARHWLGLGVLFTMLSAEEVADFHTISVFPESVKLAVRDSLGAPWLLVGIPFVLAFAFANLRFLAALPARTRNGFLLAGLVYVGGAVGVEIVEVVHYFREGYDVPMALMATAEEWMEMAGMIILLGTMLDYVRAQFPVITLELAPPAPGGVAPPRGGTGEYEPRPGATAAAVNHGGGAG